MGPTAAGAGQHPATGASLSIDLRVQLVRHRDGHRSWVLLDMVTGAVHERAERFLAAKREGTQRTYAYHLVDHLRWLVSTRLTEETRGGRTRCTRAPASCGRRA